jgi:hypothetical protein
MRHDLQNRVGLALSRLIASDLARHPEWMLLARENLDNWSVINRDSPSLLRCYTEWRALLDQPLSEICSRLTADNEEGQRLRQNSPFAGALPPAVVWQVKRRIRDEQTAA